MGQQRPAGVAGAGLLAPSATPPCNHNDLPLALAGSAGHQPLVHISHKLDNWLRDNTSNPPQGASIAADGLQLEL
jgi:hypothetical protein